MFINYLIKNVSLIQYKDFVSIYPYLISEGDEIVRALDRHRKEPVTLTQHVIKYKYIRKWMDEFLCKSQSCVIKIARVNSIRTTKSINLLYFECAVPRHDVIESTRFLMRPPVIIISLGISRRLKRRNEQFHQAASQRHFWDSGSLPCW